MNIMSDKKKIIYIIIFAAIIIIRIIPLGALSPDYEQCLSNWYKDIITYGKINSLGAYIGNYTPPYMYLLTIGTYITTNSLIWVKFVSIVFDFIMAYGVYLIAKHFKVKTPINAFLATLLIPGVILNSAAIGQCDSIFTAFLVFFIYNILKGRSKTALALFGVALSFKIQAIFVAPIFLYLLISKKVKWYDFIFLIIGLVGMMVPSMIYGKTFMDIVDIYKGQMSIYGSLVRSAPNLYSLLALNYIQISDLRKGILSIYAVAIAVVLVIKKIRLKEYNDETFLKRVALLSLIIPFVLPGMMDRYFYVANIFIFLIYFVFESGKNTDRGFKWFKKQEKVLFLACIIYFIAPFTINFYSQKNIIAWTMGEYLFVTIMCSTANLYIVYYYLKRYFFNIQDKNKEEIKLINQ